MNPNQIHTPEQIGHFVTCTDCQGDGKVTREMQTQAGRFADMTFTCSTCLGEGQLETPVCLDCGLDDARCQCEAELEEKLAECMRATEHLSMYDRELINV